MILSRSVRYLLRYLALAYILVLVVVPGRADPLAHVRAGLRRVLRVDHHARRDLGAAVVAAGGGDRGAAQRALRGADRAGVGAQQVSRQERAAGGHRSAVRRVARGGRRRADPAVGFGGCCWGSSRTIWASRSSSACPASCWRASSSPCRSSSARSSRCCTSWAPIRRRPPPHWARSGGRRSGGSPCRPSGGV